MSRAFFEEKEEFCMAEKHDDMLRKRLVGGRELTMEEYAAYLKVLSVKVLLTAAEASTLFDIGINRVKRLMASPDCDFVTCAGGTARRPLLHREAFERYLLAHCQPVTGDDDGEV